MMILNRQFFMVFVIAGVVVAALAGMITGIKLNHIAEKSAMKKEFIDFMVRVKLDHDNQINSIIEEYQSTIDVLQCVNQDLQDQINGLEILNKHEAVYKVTATFYTASEDETDSDPHLTATMTTPTMGRTIAVSRDLFPLLKGKRVYIKGHGVFVVEDTMHPRWKRKVDILVNNKSTAFEMGKKELYMLVLPDTYRV